MMTVHTGNRAQIRESTYWTVDRVKERLREVAAIERIMQKPRGPAGYKSCLPDPIQKYPEEVAVAKPSKPVGFQFTIYDEVMVDRPWSLWTTKDEWRVIWLWAQDRMGWKSIAFKCNMDKRGVLRRFHAGLNRIVQGLNNRIEGR